MVEVKLYDFVSKRPFTENDSSVFASLTAHYPFSALLHSIHARIACQLKDCDKERILTQAAIRSINRTALQAFVFANEHPRELSQKDIQASSAPDIIESNKNTQEGTTGEEKLADTTEDIKLFEQQYLAETLAAGYILGELEKEPEAKGEETQSIAGSVKSNEKENITPAPNQREESPVDKQHIDTGLSKKTFSQWMETLSEGGTAPVPKAKKPTAKTDTKSIIDSFIKNEDHIVPKRQEFFNPAKAAKLSLQEQDDLVTETLANIYATQGNIQKAISTYEKLSLKHPEKSSYFAARINELKKTFK